MHYVFGEFELDTQRYELRQAGLLQPLEPQGFNVLAYLLAHRDRVVSKSELLEHLWPHQYVTEATLTQRLVAVRRALEDDGRTQRYIRTVHGRGYRFVAAVVERSAPGSPGPSGLLEPVALPLSAREPQGTLIGREGEIARLHECLTRALQGERQVVFASGEAGIGKTTLVDAFVAQVQAATPLWLGRGQCVEQYGAGEAYLPLLEALGRLGRTPARESLVTALRQQAPSWLGQLPALVSAEDYATLARHTPGLTRERMLRELAEALEGVTATQPLLMVLEDLHWSDVSTVEWLSYVARRRDRAQLLIVGTYRPGEAIARHHPLHLAVQELRRQGHALEVPLPYWSVPEVTAYLVQRFDALPCAPDVVQLLHQRTKGHPFFLVTVVDALVRQGVLRAGASGWELAGGREAVTTGVPESVRQLIEQQLEQLPPEDRAILETASVVGVEFAAVAVATGMDQAVEVIEARCATLARRGQFIHARGATDWPDGTVTAQYGFLHALHQAVLYEQVPPNRRMRWHRQIGARLEAGHGARARDIAVELADHFVRGRDMPRAVQYLQYAGEQALQRSAYQEASAHFTHGLDLLQALPDTGKRAQQAIDLRLALRQALHPLGEYERILTSLRQAEPLALALDDGPRRGRIAVYMASCLRQLGDHAGAMATSQRALATAAGDVALQVVAQHLLGQSYYSLGDFRRAQELFRQNIALLTGAHQCESFGLSYLPAVGSRTFLVFCLTQLGAFAEARVHVEASVQLAETAQHPMSLIFAHRSLCRLYVERGDFAQAIPRIEQVIELCRRWHLRDGLPDDLSQLGYAYTLCGRLAEGLPLLEQAVEQSYRLHQARLYARLSRGYLLADRLVEANMHAQRALDLACTHRERSAQAWSLHLRGDLATRSTPPAVAQAEGYYEQALALAEVLGMHPLRAHCYWSLGTLYQQQAQPERAHAALSTAMELYRTMEMTFWLPETQAALAQVDVCLTIGKESMERLGRIDERR